MTDFDTDTLFWARVKHILEQAIACLPAEDQAARVAYCRSTGLHGVTAFREPDGTTRFEWGGRTLAVVDPSVWTDEAYFDDLAMTVMPAAPDDARALDGGDLS
jgi:hypothetical protein